MKPIKLYQAIKLLSLAGLLLLIVSGWVTGWQAAALFFPPLVLIFFLASERAYQTWLKAGCRALAGGMVSLLVVAIVFHENNDAQAGIGVALVLAIQYGIVFVSEAIIGLATYRPPDDNGNA